MTTTRPRASNGWLRHLHQVASSEPQRLATEWVVRRARNGAAAIALLIFWLVRE